MVDWKASKLVFRVELFVPIWYWHFCISFMTSIDGFPFLSWALGRTSGYWLQKAALTRTTEEKSHSKGHFLCINCKINFLGKIILFFLHFDFCMKLLRILFELWKMTWLWNTFKLVPCDWFSNHQNQKFSLLNLFWTFSCSDSIKPRKLTGCLPKTYEEAQHD